MKTYYVIGLDEDHKPGHTMKIVSRVPVTMDNVSMAFKQLYPNVVIAQEVSGMGVAVGGEKSDTRAALVLVDELDADQDYLFGRVAADGSVAGDMAKSVRDKLKTILAALTAQDVNAELLEALRQLRNRFYGALIKTGASRECADIAVKIYDNVIARAEQKEGV